MRTAAVFLVGALALTAFARAPISEKYTLKVDTTSDVPVDFTVKLNGEVVGSYDDDSNVDLTDKFRAGKNTLTVNWLVSAPVKDQFSKSKLTVGVNRGGKWSTVLTVTATKATPKGSKTMTITAK